MKRIIPILLLIVISLNHLNIVDAVIHYASKYNLEDTKAKKNLPADEESEKEFPSKDKAEEQEKYYTGNHYNINAQFSLSANDKFVCYNTALNKHPFQDDDIQPPKAV